MCVGAATILVCAESFTFSSYLGGCECVGAASISGVGDEIEFSLLSQAYGTRGQHKGYTYQLDPSLGSCTLSMRILFRRMFPHRRPP